MNIGSIHNVWLRRAALLAYTPIFMALMVFIGVLGALCEAGEAAWFGWREVTNDSWGSVKRCWRR